MRGARLDAGATVADFKARMGRTKRSDWDATFGKFIRDVTEGREDVEFPMPDDDDDEPTAYSFDALANRPRCEAHPTHYAARCPSCYSEVKAGQRNAQDVGRLIRDDEPRF